MASIYVKNKKCPDCGKEIYQFSSKCRQCAETSHHKGIKKRFISKIRKSSGCWIWEGKRDGSGYGNFSFRSIGKRTFVRAHRYFWELTKGKIPKGKLLCHKCDNPPCVRPGHLFIGTPLDNTLDRILKGRPNRGNSKLTDKQIRRIRALRSGGRKLRTLAKQFKVSESNISIICLNKSWGEIH